MTDEIPFTALPGGTGLIPSLDGADHFQLRKAMQPGYSRRRLKERLNALCGHARAFMADWKVGSTLPGASTCRLMVNAQISPLVISIESQDFVEDLIKFEERALTTHVAPLLASMYLGDALGFALYAMATQPALYERIRGEADALLENGEPDPKGLTDTAIDVTRRFIMECMRMYPIFPGSIRNVMNSCVVEGYELPLGARIVIVQTAPHYMSEVFPDPLSFDIDRYLPPRDEHHSPGYAPYGLGTHTCLGFRWVELQLAVNLLMIAHHFTPEVVPANYRLRVSPFPSMSPSKKLKFRIAEQRRELPV